MKRLLLALLSTALVAAMILGPRRTHAFLTPGPVATTTPSEIYCYNGVTPGGSDSANGFSSDALYWILSQIGLLDADGFLPEGTDWTPSDPPPPAAANMGGGPYAGRIFRDGQGTVLGYTIVDASGLEVGYINAAGTKAAYDLNKITFAQVLAANPNAPYVEIDKHAYPGLIALDGGQFFAGFTGESYPGWGCPPAPDGPTPEPPPGAGVGGGGTPPSPYPLPAFGTGTALKLNGCATELPFGASVVDSANGVPGITASGNVDSVYKPKLIEYSGTLTEILCVEGRLEHDAGSVPQISAFLQLMQPDELRDELKGLEQSCGGRFKVTPLGKTDVHTGFNNLFVVSDVTPPGGPPSFVLEITPGSYYLSPVVTKGGPAQLDFKPDGGPRASLGIPRGAIDGWASVFLHPAAHLFQPGPQMQEISLEMVVDQYTPGLDLTVTNAELRIEHWGRPGDFIGVWKVTAEGASKVEAKLDPRDKRIAVVKLKGDVSGAYVVVGKTHQH